MLVQTVLLVCSMLEQTFVVLGNKAFIFGSQRGIACVWFGNNELNVDWLSNSELLVSASGNVRQSVASDLLPTLVPELKDPADLVTDRLVAYWRSDTNHIVLRPNLPR